MNTEKKFTILRHSKKDASGEISAEGKDMAKDKAVEIFQEIEELPDGTVICFIPSDIGRAKETKNILQANVEILMTKEKEKYAIANLGKDDVLKLTTDSPDKKILLKTDFFDSRLGWTKPSPEAGKNFKKYFTMFNGDEDLIGMFWLTRQDEIEDFKNEASRKNQPFQSEVNPAELQITPEGEVLLQLRWLKDIKKIADKFFPNKMVKIYGISHNWSSDFTIMTLLGMPLSLHSVLQLGGKFRDFLESSDISFGPDGIMVKFKDKTHNITNKNLEQIISDLEQAKADREKEWTNSEK